MTYSTEKAYSLDDIKYYVRREAAAIYDCPSDEVRITEHSGKQFDSIFYYFRLFVYGDQLVEGPADDTHLGALIMLALNLGRE